MAGKVMFIVPGRLRADCVSGETAGAVRLPNLRLLMAQGVTFANHFTVTAPCGPSRASLLTGRYAMNHRSIRNGTPLADHIPNLAREVGYEPLLFGYTDTSADPVSRAPSDPDLTDYKGVLPGFREPIEMRMAELPDEDADALRAVYFKLATEADNHVGRLLDYLDETGQAGDALVVMTSDHGEMLGDKRMWGKCTFHDPAYRVPLIIRDPRSMDAADKIVDRFTESIDIAPTILDWIGSKPPHEFDGRSLIPFLRGSSPDE